MRARRRAVHRQRRRHRGDRSRPARSTDGARRTRARVRDYGARSRRCAGARRQGVRGSAAQSDDMTVLAVRWRGPVVNDADTTSANDDFDAPVARFRDAVRRRDEQLALAAADRDDVGRRDASSRSALCECVSARWRASSSLNASLPTASVCPTTITSAHRALRQVGEYAFEDPLRFLGQLGRVLDEVQREMRGAARLCGERVLNVACTSASLARYDHGSAY